MDIAVVEVGSDVVVIGPSRQPAAMTLVEIYARVATRAHHAARGMP